MSERLLNTYHFSRLTPTDWEIVCLSPTGDRLSLPDSADLFCICSSEQEAFEQAVAFAARTDALIANGSIPDQLYQQTCKCPELDVALRSRRDTFCSTGLSLLSQAKALSSQSAGYNSDHPLSKWFGDQATALYRGYEQHVHGYKVGDIRVSMFGRYAEPEPAYQYALYQYTDEHIFELIAKDALLVDVLRATLGCFRYHFTPYPYRIQAAWDRAGLYRKRQETSACEHAAQGGGQRL